MKLLIVGTIMALASCLKVNQHETIFETCKEDSDCPEHKWCTYTPWGHCVDCCFENGRCFKDDC